MKSFVNNCKYFVLQIHDLHIFSKQCLGYYWQKKEIKFTDLHPRKHSD